MFDVHLYRHSSNFGKREPAAALRSAALGALVGLLFAILGALQPSMVRANARRAVVFEPTPTT